MHLKDHVQNQKNPQTKREDTEVEARLKPQTEGIVVQDRNLEIVIAEDIDQSQ